MSSVDKRDKPGAVDAGMRAALFGVIGSAVALSLGALALAGPRAALGVAIGGAIAPLNLWVFAQVGEAFLSRRGRTAPWAAIGVIKLVVLLGGVWLILRSGVASGLSLIVGYGALPLGITVGTLFGPKPPEEPGEADQKPLPDDSGLRKSRSNPRLEESDPPSDRSRT